MKKVFMLLVSLIGIIFSVNGQKHVQSLSKWDKKRPYRPATLYIIIHDTEAKDKSSLNTLKRYGTCNFFVSTTGVIYDVISEKKLAKHAGISMWYGKKNLSNYTIGIETGGFYNKKPTVKQLAALKTLVTDLKRRYRLGDNKVLTHSMIAYGIPDRKKWYTRNHRGRKRCAMLFATADIRRAIGLNNTFSVDPDVKAGRLVNADPYLAKILYGGHAFDKKEEKKEKPIAKEENEKVKGTEDDFEGCREIDNNGVFSIAGEEYNSSTTIYFLPNGFIRTGKELNESQLQSLPKGTKVLIGYINGGKVLEGRTAYKIVGKRYNLASTFYRFPDGKVYSGDDVDNNVIPAGTIILFRDE